MPPQNQAIAAAQARPARAAHVFRLPAALVAQAANNHGIGKGHRYPLAVLKCLSPKRRLELELCLGLGVRRPADSAHGRVPQRAERGANHLCDRERL